MHQTFLCARAPRGNYLLTLHAPGAASSGEGYSPTRLHMLWQEIKNGMQNVLLLCVHYGIIKKEINVLDLGKERNTMAVKSANLYARIEPDVKEQAESILSSLGIPASNAINMFYKQIILHRGLPFEVKIPDVGIPDAAELTEEELNAELEKGYADMMAGKTKPARQAFVDIRKDYKI